MTPAPHATVRPGLCSVTFRDLEPAAVVALAAEAGLEGIEWGSDVHVPADDPRRAAEVRHLTEEAGLTCVSYGTYLRAGELVRDEVPATVEIAQILGVPTMRVWCRWLSARDVGPTDRAAIADDLRHLLDLTEDTGLAIALEHHQWTLTESVRATRDLCDLVADDRLFTYWQPCDGLGSEEMLDELDDLANDLAHLHVFWWATPEDRRPLTDGEHLWSEAIARARRPGRWHRDRWALLEFVRDDDPAQLRADARVLRALLAR